MNPRTPHISNTVFRIREFPNPALLPSSRLETPLSLPPSPLHTCNDTEYSLELELKRKKGWERRREGERKEGKKSESHVFG